jgi:uncharacterized membrane protein
MERKMYTLSIMLPIVSNVLYHVFQKLTPSDVNPLIALSVTYIAATIICLLLLPLFPSQPGFAESLGRINWASVALGFAIVGLEAGYLMAYRADWNISLASMVANVAVALLLIPVGLLFFREKLSITNYAGLVVCMIGLALVNRK